MLKKQRNGIEWLEFESLQDFPEVKHAVFLRTQDFNLHERGPRSNQEKVLEILGLKKGVKLKQVHKDQVYDVKRAREGWSLKENFDALMTREKDVGLLIRHADCQATIFYDPKNQVIANAHCGWRGSVQNIYRQVIQKMKEGYGTNPADLRVCISPSLGPDAAEFRHFESELPKAFWSFQVRPTYFDFWSISQAQLGELGVAKSQIEIAGICTYETEDLCYSYRRNKETGHHGTLVALSN